MRLKRYFQTAYIIIGSLTVLEFIFVRGMFTWLLAVVATIIIGIINVIASLRDTDWQQALLFLLATVALCMGYFVAF